MPGRLIADEHADADEQQNCRYALRGVIPKVLTESLRAMERDGIVKRTP
jgi:DNA-binding HxlR family transcriptional regulator